MKRGRLPLTALRSFESAGRLQSFTAAAEELFVSQAAISRQIRDLELQLGRPLFERVHRGVALTEHGANLLAALTASFDSIDSALTDIGHAADVSQVTISSEPTFAALWLVPHLQQFRDLHPNVEVTIESDPRIIEFRANQADIAIRFSEARVSWPRTEAVQLTETFMVPVTAPDLIAGKRPIAAPVDLLRQTLLHDENRDIWARWFQMAGSPPPENERGPVLADGALVLQAVLRGHGVGLIDELFAREEIAAGRIVSLFDVHFPCGAYFLVARDFSRLSPGARSFVDWIRAEFEEE
jgi:LysR family transcriptional regulator, glycine cleavage system transcriptional activator